MSDLAKREENGRLGEALAVAVLLKRFWVLDRSVDVEGADYLVQKRHDSLKKLRQNTKKIEALGIVQAKFFQDDNRVEIKSHYVVDENGPREDFFCFIFTEDEDGEDVSYFFTAKDIVESLNLSKDGRVYYFKILQGRQYEGFKNLKKKKILDTIEDGITNVEVSRNREFIRQASFVFENATRHFDEEPNFEYHLKIHDQVQVVICKNGNNDYSHLLETRRDLFHCHSGYGWGNYSSAVKLLATSMLSHHLDGQHPPEQAVFSLIENKLALLDRNEEYIIKSSEINTCILGQLDYLDTLARKEIEFLRPINQDAEFFVVLRRDKNTVTLQSKSSEVIEIDFPDEHLLLSDIDRIVPVSRQSIDLIKPKLLYPLVVERNSSNQVVQYYDLIQYTHYDN